MGTGRCKHMSSAKLPAPCPCKQGIFLYDLQTQTVKDQCETCDHSPTHHGDVELPDKASIISSSKPADSSAVLRALKVEFKISASKSLLSYPKLHLPTVMVGWTPRPIVVQRILQRAFDYSIVLVRGTPACGKTILMYLIAEHIAKTYPGLTFHGLRGWPSDLSFEGSQDYLQKCVGMSQLQVMSAKNTVICIDDAQSSYYDDELWSFLKILDRGGATFILFSSYGSAGPSPVDVKSGTSPIFHLGQRISLQWESDLSGSPPVGLLLQRNEAEDLITRYCAENPTQPNFPPDVRNIVITISGGHAGALAGLIETVATNSVSIAFNVEKLIMLIALL